MRIKSILAKYIENGGNLQTIYSDIKSPVNNSEKQLMMELAKFNASVEVAAEEYAPHKLCAYIYDLANAFNHFYHETKILAEEDMSRKAGWIALLTLTRDVLETSIDLLGFSAPERM